jgi:hypothetical protein
VLGVFGFWFWFVRLIYFFVEHHLFGETMDDEIIVIPTEKNPRGKVSIIVINYSIE